MARSLRWAVERAASLHPLIVTPPTGGPDVCRVCHGRARADYSVCYPCATATSRVRWPARHIVPISLYRSGSELHRVLRHYKDSPEAAVRSALAGDVAALVGAFLFEHGSCVAPEGWDGLVVVPSSRGRAGSHPLEQALASVPWIERQLTRSLDPDATGDGPRCADEALYRTIADVRGLSLIVIDDTLTTGARVHSAASALTSAGARIPAVITVGRAINPAASPSIGDWWARQAASARVRGAHRCVCCAEGSAEPALAAAG